MIRPQLLLVSLVVLLGCFQTVQSAAADGRAPQWPIPIPYSFDSQYDEAQRQAVRDSHATFYDNTCLEFKEDAGAGPKILYTIVAQGSCSANIRYSPYLNVTVFLLPGCVGTVGIQHETVHALGFRHTQVRHDRDAYVKVNPALLENSNYRKLDETINPTYGIPYEYNSLLHYGASANLSPIDPDYSTIMGGGAMTFNDWKLVNMHYKCGEKCSVALTCHNGGYQHPRKCTECICPQFHAGKQCEQERNALTLVPGQPKQFNYKYVHDSTVFNDKIKEFNRSPYTLVKAPAGSRIRVTIDAISDYRSTWEMPRYCGTRAVEIVDGDMTRVGKRFCANDSTGRSFVSTTNIVGYNAFSPLGYGFSANVTFTVEN